MNGREIGSASLRLDAAYCAVSALLVAAFSPWLAAMTGASAGLVVTAAVAIAGWAAALWFAPKRVALRPMLLTVTTANILAAVGIGLLALAAPNLGSAVLAVAIFVEVAAFAVSQALSLRTL